MKSSEEHVFEKMELVSPVWTDVIPVREFIPIGERTILHAGPPIDTNRMAKAVLNSAVIAVLYEGWADDPDLAREMVLSGEVELKPAQDLNAAVPLASVMSPSMLALVIIDENNPSHKAISTINGGMQHALRLGLNNKSVLDHLIWLNNTLGEALRKSIPSQGIPLIPLADYALTQGDDCHGRTIVASEKLLEGLKQELSQVADGEAAIQYIADCPPFFLNLWMAAIKCIFSAVEDTPGSSAITSMGGNGIEFGLQVAGLPGRWFTTPASVPTASYVEGMSDKNGLGAIGDSAIVDAFGLGAMAVNYSQAQQKAFDSLLPKDAQSLPEKLLNRSHTYFKKSGIRFGLSAEQIVNENTSIVISLGVIDIDGEEGRVGGGIYQPPIELFNNALIALQD